MATIRQMIIAQGQKPSGILGWLSAGVMLVEGPSGCSHAKIARLLDLQPEDEVLDVACGSGLFLHRHAAHAKRVAGVDHSELQIALARRVLRRRLGAGTAQVIEGDAAVLPWPDDGFSAVTCNCLAFLPDPEGSLAEMFRVLRPEGRLVLGLDFFGDPATARREEREWGLHAWTEPELRALVNRAGFADVSVTHDTKRIFAAAVKHVHPQPEPARRGSAVPS